MLIAYMALAVGLFCAWKRVKFDDWRDRGLIVLITVLVSSVVTARLPYLPLAFLFPAHLLFFEKRRIAAAGVLVATLAYPVIWNIAVASLVHHDQFAGVNEKHQIGWIIHYPIEAFSRIISAPIHWKATLFVGETSSLLLPEYCYTLLISALVILSVGEFFSGRIEIPNSGRIILVLSILVSVFLLMAVSFIAWTHVGEPVPNRVTGRYFLPLALLSVFLPWSSRHRSNGWENLIFSGISISGLAILSFVNLIALVTVVHGYFYIR